MARPSLFLLVAASFALAASCKERPPSPSGSSAAPSSGSVHELYRAYLAKEFVDFELTNLAVGGYSTYQMPIGLHASGRPSAPVPEHNITFALSLRPDAILINMPSNDQALGIPLSEQMANFARVTDLAAQRGALTWVTTSQPRNFSDASQRRSLVAARDAVQAKYAGHTLDFWTPFADPDGKIKPMYDAGDGTHMNDAAHALLVQRVIAAKVPDTVLTRTNLQSSCRPQRGRARRLRADGAFARRWTERRSASRAVGHAPPKPAHEER